MIKEVKYSSFNFGPYVMKTELPEYILQRLKEDGDKAKQSFNHALAGQLNNQFVYNSETTKWFYNEITPIFRAYREGHCKYHQQKSLPVELKPLSLWINYMKAGDFNPLHTHSGDYSFVVFVDVPEEIHEEEKRFEGTGAKPGSFTMEFTQQSRPKWATTGISVPPRTGEMFIFPALLQHWVCPFKSNVTRISVSGNVAQINNENNPHDYF